MLGLLHFLGDHHHPYKIVGTLTGALAPGSPLVLTHVTGDFDPGGIAAAAAVYREHGMEIFPRTYAEFARLLTGLELIAPGLTVPHRWHPRAAPVPAAQAVTDPQRSPQRGVISLTQRRDARVSIYAGVGRIPAPPAGWR